MRRITRAVVLLAAVVLVPAGAFAQTIFWLDTPAEGATVSGIVEVSGWILDERGVSNIDLYVDGVKTATADIDIARYDVLQAYPWYAATQDVKPGFRTSFEGSVVGTGIHTLFLRVTFSDSTVQDFGHRSFTVDSVNQAPFGELEYPERNGTMNGVYPIQGWALDDGSVTRVQVVVDGGAYGEAVMGVHRPDVANRFPGVSSAEYAGFIYNINTARLTNGVHVIGIRLWDDQGASRLIGQRRVQVFNNDRNLAPFGRIEYPMPNHTIFATGCWQGGGWSGSPYEEPAAVEVIRGWVLDVDMANDDSGDDGGVAWVELLVDGEPLISTNDGACWWWDPYNIGHGFEVNCYGQLRQDIAELYSDVLNAKHSQFIFALDVNWLLFAVWNNPGFQGLHYISVRAGDRSGHQAIIDTIPIIIDCNEDPDFPVFGDVYTPEVYERVQGIVPVTGWALDPDRIIDDIDPGEDGVEIWIDGVWIGNAEYGLPSQEVWDNYPWVAGIAPNVRNCGFEYDLDTTQFSDGEHELVVIARDRRQAGVLHCELPDHGANQQPGCGVIGQRTFLIDNLNSGTAKKAGTAAARKAMEAGEGR